MYIKKCNDLSVFGQERGLLLWPALVHCTVRRAVVLSLSPPSFIYTKHLWLKYRSLSLRRDQEQRLKKRAVRASARGPRVSHVVPRVEPRGARTIL